MMTLSKQQKKLLTAEGNALILGAAGTAKTTMLLAKADALVKSGVNADKIAVMLFSYRSAKLVEAIAQKRYPQTLSGVQFVTLKDLTPPPTDTKDATNNQARDMIKRAMIEVGFKGGLSEAEHVIRAFKARSRKPQENEPHYLLLQTYKKLLESENLTDRHDRTRAHILAMRKGAAPAAAAEYILVDNVQDATQIQLVWLEEHIKHGKTVWFTCNDDATIFGQDGAEGANAASIIEGFENVRAHTLSENFRIPRAVHGAISKTARLLKQRLQKQDSPQNGHAATLQALTYEHEYAEHDALVAALKARQETAPQQRLGVVVRHDYLANRLLHACHKAGLRPASYARPIWEKPGAGTVMAMLYLIMGQSSGVRFERFLLTHLGAGLGGRLASSGLTPEHFLRSQELPDGVELGADHVRTYHTLRRRVAGYIRLLQSGQVDAREVFKATVADTLPKLSAEEQEDALLAASILLNLKGKIAEILPRLEQESLPDMQSNIVITPVRETRNMEFDALFVPYLSADVWPPAARALPVDLEHERRLFHQALSRTKGDVVLSCFGRASGFFKEMG